MGRPRKVLAPPPKQGSNGPTPEQAAEIVNGIEEQHKGLLNLRMDYMRDCQPYHQRIKDLLERGAKTYGMDRRAVKSKVKQRHYLRKADEIRGKLDDEEAEAFDVLSEQLGPLGAAAKRSHDAGAGRAHREAALDELAGASGPPS